MSVTYFAATRKIIGMEQEACICEGWQEVCPHCGGKGYSEEPLFSIPDLNFSNINSSILQRLCGIEYSAEGTLKSKELPIVLRNIMVALSDHGKLKAEEIEPSDEQETYTESEGNVVFIKKGLRVIDFGMSVELLEEKLRLFQRFLLACKEANSDVHWC